MPPLRTFTFVPLLLISVTTSACASKEPDDGSSSNEALTGASDTSESSGTHANSPCEKGGGLCTTFFSGGPDSACASGTKPKSEVTGLSCAGYTDAKGKNYAPYTSVCCEPQGPHDCPKGTAQTNDGACVSGIQ